MQKCHRLQDPEHLSDLFTLYLGLLGVRRRPPSLDALSELTLAHLTHVPFENISKLYYRRDPAGCGLPTIEQYLDGIERYHLGGTCYANNFHFHRLLAHLGYEVALCGADMSAPDVHLVNIVTLGDCQYLVDGGYAAPFLAPMPLRLSGEYELAWGRERYVLKPRDNLGRWRLELHREGILRHSYYVNPTPRRIEEFAKAIADSFRPQSTFMNAILIARFYPRRSVTLRNLDLIEADAAGCTVRAVARERLPDTIEEQFNIAREITEPVLDSFSLAEEP